MLWYAHISRAKKVQHFEKIGKQILREIIGESVWSAHNKTKQ